MEQVVFTERKLEALFECVSSQAGRRRSRRALDLRLMDGHPSSQSVTR